MKRLHVKTTKHTAETAIPKYAIVKFGTAEETVSLATAASDGLIGVTVELDVEIGEPCEVFRCGLAPVVYGGTITKGSLLTTNATGQAIASSAGNRIIGIAEESGIADDIGSVLLSFGVA